MEMTREGGRKVAKKPFRILLMLFWDEVREIPNLSKNCSGDFPLCEVASAPTRFTQEIVWRREEEEAGCCSRRVATACCREQKTSSPKFSFPSVGAGEVKREGERERNRRPKVNVTLKMLFGGGDSYSQHLF